MATSLIDRSFKENLLFSYATQAIIILVGFVNVTLVTRFAGVDIYGALSVLIAFSAILANLLTFRTNEAVIAFYKRGAVTHNPGQCKFVLVVGVFLDVAVGLMLLALLHASAEWLARVFIKRPELAAAVALYSWVLLANFLRGTPAGYLMARDRFKLLYALNVVEPAGRALIVSGFILAGHQLTLEVIIWGSLIPSVLVLVIVCGALLKELLFTLWREKMDWGLLPEYIRFSLNTFLSSSLKAGSQNIDTLVLGYVAGPATVGVYNLMRQFLAPLGLLVSPFTGQLYPRFVHAVAEHRRKDVQHTIGAVNRRMRLLFLALISGATIALVLYFDWLNVAWGMNQAVAFMALALNGYVLQQMWWNRPLSNAIDPNISLRANIYATIFLLVVIYPLTYWFGLAGTALSMLSLTIMLQLYWRRILVSL